MRTHSDSAGLIIVFSRPERDFVATLEMVAQRDKKRGILGGSDLDLKWMPSIEHYGGTAWYLASRLGLMRGGWSFSVAGSPAAPPGL